MKKLLCLALCLFTFSVMAQGTTNIRNQIEVAFRPDFTFKDKDIWLGEVSKYQQSLSDSGTWIDIDYSAVASLDFSPKTHLSRTAVMAEGYGTPGQVHYQSKTLLAKIHLAVKHWVDKDYQSYNWWHNEIGTQQYLIRTVVLTGNDLGSNLVKKSMEIFKRTEIKQTGQNRMWRSEIVFVRGVLSGEVKDAQMASEEIEGLLVFDQQEGIQSDGSFLQHGELIYNGGYGDKFVQIMARYLAMVDGSSYDFNSSSKQRFINHVLNAQLWLTRNNKYDFGVMGRALTVKNRTALFLASACDNLSRMNVKEKARLINCYQSIFDNKVSGLEGHKSFYRSDFAVQQEKEYFASVRMYSKRTMNTDFPSNGEGLMSHHLADGAMMLMKDGSEYANIFPVWDWNKIPGTTVEQKAIIPARYVPERWDLFAHMVFQGESDFAGSVSNGRYGASGFNFISNPKYDKLRAKKSWFFFDQAIWAMGSDINCADCQEVKTTLNQTLSQGDVMLISTQGLSSSVTGIKTEKNVFAILHQNVGYVFPSEQNVTVSHKVQEGDWKTINSSLKSEIVREKVFSATINHGASPASEGYEYVIFPETTEAKIKELKIKDDFSFVNSRSAHGVFSKKQNLLQASFFEAGSIKLEGLRIQTSGPCLVMVQLKGSEMSITVSDPTQGQKEVQLSVNGRPYKAIYPIGIKAGSSITL